MAICIHMQSTHGAQGEDGAFFFVVHKRMSRQYKELTYIFICGGGVCGRDADVAHLIKVSVSVPPSVVGSHSKLPSTVIILIISSLGSRVCTLILNQAF